MSFCALLSASSDDALEAAKRHRRTKPATDSMSESAPKPMRAMELAASRDRDGGLYAVPAHPEPRQQLRMPDQLLPLVGLLGLADQPDRLAVYGTVTSSPNTAPSSERPASVSEYMTSLPARREVTSPCKRSSLRWCETRFWARAEIQARSHTHNSSPSRNAAASISRVGSESARARSAATRVASPPGNPSRTASPFGASTQSRSQRSSFMPSL